MVDSGTFFEKVFSDCDVSYKFIGQVQSLPVNSDIGDVLLKDGEIYVRMSSNSWYPMTVTTTTNPVELNPVIPQPVRLLPVCRGCGAPVRSRYCEYCGSDNKAEVTIYG